MQESIATHLRQSLIMLALMTLLTGLVYPAAMTLLGQAAFNRQVNGSLIRENGRLFGSEFIGQTFTSPGNFWSRPSNAGAGYDASASSASNLGPINPALRDAVASRVEAVRAGRTIAAPVPVDLITGSGSGLDPHITPAAALYQAPRVAQALGIEEPAVRNLILRHVESRTFGLLGEPRVNVLRLNLALDQLSAGQ